MAEGFCATTRDSSVYDQIVPDQDELFFGPSAADGPEGASAPPGDPPRRPLAPKAVSTALQPPVRAGASIEAHLRGINE